MDDLGKTNSNSWKTFKAMLRGRERDRRRQRIRRTRRRNRRKKRRKISCGMQLQFWLFPSW